MQTLETKSTVGVQRLSEVTQSALVTLVVGEQIGEDDLSLLQERRIQFGVLFGGKLCKFYLDDVVLYPKLDKWSDGTPKDRVLINAETESGSEYVWLNVNAEGETNFDIIPLE